MSIRVAGRSGFSRLPMIKIFDQTLASAGKFDITEIPPSHSSIRMLMQLRTDQAVTVGNVSLFFNNDTTAANYRRLRHVASAAAHAAAEADDAAAIICLGSSAPANNFTDVEVIIPNYANDKNKQARGIMWGRDGAAAMSIYDRMIHWENTAVINRVTIEYNNDPTNELIADSRVIMWLTA